MQQTDGDRMQQIAGPEPATSRQEDGGARCGWGRMSSTPCRAPATWVSGTIAACDLHRALRDAQDETTVTWRALARAAAIMSLPVILFMAGCGS